MTRVITHNILFFITGEYLSPRERMNKQSKHVQCTYEKKNHIYIFKKYIIMLLLLLLSEHVFLNISLHLSKKGRGKNRKSCVTQYTQHNIQTSEN